MVDSTKQPEGCIGISKKCVFVLKSLLSLYQEQLMISGFIRAIVVFQVLFFNFISFQKNATAKAVAESRAKVFSLRKNKSTHCFLSGSHDFACCFSPFGE